MIADFYFNVEVNKTQSLLQALLPFIGDSPDEFY